MPADVVLVDTSVWVRFFRAEHSPVGKALNELLAATAVVTCPPIHTEVVSGAPTKREFQRLRTLFGAITSLDPPNEMWFRIEECRFALARRGVQASLVDLWIALTASHHRVVLWSLDDDFRSIAPVVPFAWYQPQVQTP